MGTIVLEEAYLSQKLANVFTLVALQLNHLTILWMLNHSPIAGKFLWGKIYKLNHVLEK